MKARLGRLTATLAEPLSRISADLIEKINRNINPPTPVTAEMVEIRAMYVVNDRVNSFGGRFPADEHCRLVELLIDSPVLVGHRKDKLPVARTFHATACTENGERWVKAYFYWLKTAEGAESLRENIDAGIYKECSIGFTFVLAECSICGRDIRLCDHEPFQTYTVGGHEQTCHFMYRKIERVLESSLVYRGATPNTRISRELLHLTGIADQAVKSRPVLQSLSELSPEASYLIVPRYESMPVTIDRSGDRTSLRLPDGSVCTHPDTVRMLDAIPDRAAAGRLVGMRGKQRCSISHLVDYLAGEESEVRRLVLFLLPGAFKPIDNTAPGQVVRMLPHRTATRESLIRAASEITTRLGVELFPVRDKQVIGDGFTCHPEQVTPVTGNYYQLLVSPDSDHAVLRLTIDGDEISLLVRQYQRSGMLRGARFVADMVEPKAAIHKQGALTGLISGVTTSGEASVITLTGPLEGTFVIQPATIGGRARLLFYCRKDAGEASDDA